MREGDLLLGQRDSKFFLSKLLRITPFGDGTSTAHVMLFEPFASRPSLTDIDKSKVMVWHSPITLEAMERDCEVIGNLPVQPDDLVGYLEYLKQTDFNRYLQESGMSIEAAIASAQAAYTEGGRLCDEKKFEEAVEAYSRAIDHFPLFYEAHDNRSFALMDLARYQEAAAGFEDSLRIQPENPVALFSLGECFLKLGDNEMAVKILSQCVERWPDKPHHREFLNRAKALLVASKPDVKPSWKFWK